LVNLFERQLDNTHDKDEKKKILFRIAAIWENQIGNLFEAKDWYEQILMLWPDEANAKAGVERILKGSRIPDDVVEVDATVADDDETTEDEEEVAAAEMDTGDYGDAFVSDKDEVDDEDEIAAAEIDTDDDEDVVVSDEDTEDKE
jgi:hypothetical protein